MKLRLILVMSIATLHIAGAQTPAWQWAAGGQGSGHDYGQGIGTDGYGNCYATGYFQVPSVIFGNDTLWGDISYHDNMYLVKYNSSGNVVWARSAGDQNNSFGTDISTDAQGNSYVAGYFQGTGTINFGSYTLSSSFGSNDEAFIVKYDSSGNVIWAKEAGMTSGSVACGIDAGGNVYVAMDSGSLSVKKISSSGNLLWEKTVPGICRTPNICTDANGNSYVTGTFFSGTSMDFGDTAIINNSNGWVIFVVKYDSAGNVVWARSDGTYPSLYSPGISTDGNGNCFVTGYFNGSYAKFGSILLTNAGWQDIFVVKYNALGNVAWATRAGGIDADAGHDIVSDGNGNTYVTGMFRWSASFGSVNLYANAWNDAFVAKYDSSGNVLWAKSAGGNNVDISSGIAIDPVGNSYVTGHFFSPYVYFDSSMLANYDTISNPAEVFIAKLGSSPAGLREMYDRRYFVSAPYPNPAINATRVDYTLPDGATEGEIVFYDLHGREVKRFPVDRSFDHLLISTADLPAGTYYYRLQAAGMASGGRKMVVVK